MQKVCTQSLIILFTCGFILFWVPQFTAAADDDEAMSMQVSPEGTLYDIENMKPGDWAPRTVTIANNGQTDFSYVAEVDNHGPEKLFNELILEVKTTDDTIYSGKVADFTQLTARKLEAGQMEEIEFTIRFPEHLGNDYQGLNTSFSLIFTVVDKEENSIVKLASKGPTSKKESGDTNATDSMAALDGTIGSDDDNGSGLPNTATSIYNFLIIGSVLAISGGIFAAYSRKRNRA